MSSLSNTSTKPLDYDTDKLRAELTAFGKPPGPITHTTKNLYIKRLIKLKENTTNIPIIQKKEIKFSDELEKTLKYENFQCIKDNFIYITLSQEDYKSSNIKLRGGHLKQSFIYMLIDPRMLPTESQDIDKFVYWQQFLKSIFYVGKGTNSRTNAHFRDAIKVYLRLQAKMISTKSSSPQIKYCSKKDYRILDIWDNGKGVVSLQVFHNILSDDACTREAAIIDALGLQHLTNRKRGDYYGASKTWTLEVKQYFGIALLYKAMCTHLNEGESQLFPNDLIKCDE